MISKDKKDPRTDDFLLRDGQCVGMDRRYVGKTVYCKRFKGQKASSSINLFLLHLITITMTPVLLKGATRLPTVWTALMRKVVKWSTFRCVVPNNGKS